MSYVTRRGAGLGAIAMFSPLLQLRRRLARLAPLAALPLLSGCGMVVLDPAGDVARQQGMLVMVSTGLMLIIIIPVMILTALFAWRYRAANREARYEPDWDHSTQLELVIWAAPLAIIICLGALTWVGTHLLDPYRSLARVAPGQPDLDAAAVKPLDIEVVALDWKWLFIYPDQGIATVNELAVPIDRPVRFRISASSVMNSFYIPAMAGQIYAMPGMQTTLHAVLNKPGTYEGFSANYSGAGFSNMRFKVHGVDGNGFNAWLAKARDKKNGALDRPAYLALERPSEKVPVRYFASVDPTLFDAVLNLCVEPGKMCMHDMMAADAQGGLGLAGIRNVRELSYDKFGARGTQAPLEKRFVVSGCAVPRAPIRPADATPVDLAPLMGAGLERATVSAPVRVADSDPSTFVPSRLLLKAKTQ
jgi:cytochrome o ubiquinol oxidase subunit 2